jgi:hypothetical protein
MNAHTPRDSAREASGVTAGRRDDDILRAFRKPPRDYGIYPIRHNLCALASSPRRLAAETARLARRGFGGVVTNPGWGPDYLNTWRPLRRVVRALERAGFVIYLYDEKGYPSGSAGGRVLERHPELETVGMMVYRLH